MDWLNTALWNLCMSMLSHRNTRALLVPVICVALLIPLASCAEERRQSAPNARHASILSTGTDGSPLAGFVARSVASTASNGGYVQDQTTASMIALAQQTQRGSPSATPAPSPPTRLSAGHAGVASRNGGGMYMQTGKAGNPNRSDDSKRKPRRTKPGAASMQAAGYSLTTAATATATSTADSDFNTELHDAGYGDEGQEQAHGLEVQAGSRVQGPALLDRDDNGVVPRKFTIPEPSVVADADQKYIAILPPKPYEMAASQQSLVKREVVARSGVSLVDTMIVVTVDGRIYGISRYDGSIVWQRDGLPNPNASSSCSSGKSTCPRGMVWTRSDSADSTRSSIKADDICSPSNNGAGHNSTDAACDSGEGYIDDDYEDDGEEEWLLEQGIDWRSDPQVLEHQRQQRREWLAKRKRKPYRSPGAASRSNSSSGSNYAGNAGAADDDVPEVLYIAEPGNGGTLYVYNSEAGLHKLPLTIQDLVDQSPVQTPEILYTGTKEASFVAIDLATGRLLDFYGEDRGGTTYGSRDDGQKPKARAQIKVLLGEKLNRVKIFPTGEGTGNLNSMPKWELYHRLIDTPSLDPEVDAILSEIGDAVEALGASSNSKNRSGSDDDDDDVVPPNLHGPAKFVMTNDGGFVMVEASTGMPLWAQEFDSPVVSVFDVFGISNPDSDDGDGSARISYVARRRSLSPVAQQRRYLRWRHRDANDDARHRGLFGFGSSRSQDSKWRTGSAGGNILAGPFWERTSGPSSLPQIAYIGKLQDTLYTLTSDEFPLIDHQSLISSLLHALVEARRRQQHYPELQTPEWWDRWNFLTHDPVVLRILQEARGWWLRPASATDTGLVIDPRLGEFMDATLQNYYQASDNYPGVEWMAPHFQGCRADDRCHNDGIVGLHPVKRLPDAVPEVGGEPLYRPGLPEGGQPEDARDGEEGAEEGASSQAEEQRSSGDATALVKDDDDEWAWWRYVGHYMTRVAAFIGYVVTITFLFAFVGAIYLLRPRNKRRPRMWIDAEGDNDTRPGRRARLRISWALMHRMWDTLKEEWRLAVDEAWRNPNAAAVLRRTGVGRRSSLKDSDEDSGQELSRQSNGSVGTNGQSTQTNLGRRGSTSASPPSFSGFSREDSEPSSFDRLSSGQQTPRRNSTGTLPMTPLKRLGTDGDSIERAQPATPRAGQQQQQQQLRLGAITLSDQVLGYGSHGTVVYRGEFQGRAVAVKRLLLDFYDVADHEVQVLQESDSHPNVIRYFCTERHDHFMYIALELCCGSLADAVMRSPKAALAQQLLSAIPKQKVLYQLARGLHHLHALKLVHRDIKPQNILIAPPPHRRRRRTPRADGAEPDELAFEDSNIVAGGVPRVLISDFGLSRILDDDESSFANTFTMRGVPAFGSGAGMAGVMPGGLPAGMIGGIGGGTVGWRAPECFDSPEARGAVPSGLPLVSSSTGSDGTAWPSLHGPMAEPAEEPSPYVSRGTKSRLRHLAMTQTTRTQQQQHQKQPQQPEGDDPDSTGTSVTTATDRAESNQFVGVGSSRRRMTRAVDIFSMGCVFYYVLMDGDHPFGDRLSREQRILAGSPDLRALEASDNPSAIEAVDLVAHMVARHERDRPSAASVLVHPYFWDATQRLGFIQDVSDCLEAEARLIKVARESIPEPPKKTKTPKKKGGQPPPPPPADKTESHAISHESIEDIIAQLPAEQAAAVRRAITLLDTFEENSSFVMEGPPPSADGFQVVGMPPSHASALESMNDALAPGSDGKTSKPRRVAWDRRLDSHLRRDLGKFRKYDGTRLRDLLRVIRNKKNHYQDMPPPLREALGDIPDGYLHYFESRFPYLLLHCYYFILENDGLRTATVFRPYFRPPAL